MLTDAVEQFYQFLTMTKITCTVDLLYLSTPLKHCLKMVTNSCIAQLDNQWLLMPLFL
jgi:hypothetical protein